MQKITLKRIILFVIFFVIVLAAVLLTLFIPAYTVAYDGETVSVNGIYLIRLLVTGHDWETNFNFFTSILVQVAGSDILIKDAEKNLQFTSTFSDMVEMFNKYSPGMGDNLAVMAKLSISIFVFALLTFVSFMVELYVSDGAAKTTVNAVMFAVLIVLSAVYAAFGMAYVQDWQAQSAAKVSSGALIALPVILVVLTAGWAAVKVFYRRKKV